MCNMSTGLVSSGGSNFQRVFISVAGTARQGWQRQLLCQRYCCSNTALGSNSQESLAEQWCARLGLVLQENQDLWLSLIPQAAALRFETDGSCIKLIILVQVSALH